MACSTQSRINVDTVRFYVKHINRFMKQDRYMMKFFCHILSILPQILTSLHLSDKAKFLKKISLKICQYTWHLISQKNII